MLEEIVSSVKQVTSHATQAAPLGLAAYLTTLIPLGTLLEWGVHKVCMHQPKGKRIKFISEKQSRTHQDEHHGAYSAPKHYFQDTYNQEITSEFGWVEIAKLFFGSLGVSTGAVLAYNKLFPGHAITTDQAAGIITGTVAAVMTYYRTYETTHQWMHVLEKELQVVNKALAYHLQPEPDGKVLVPLPFLDRFDNHVINEARALQKDKNYVPVTRDDIADDLDHYLERSRIKGVEVTQKSGQEILDAMIKEHAAYMDEHPDARQSRFMNWVRSGKWSPFRKMHRHHYMHHADMKTNLNVVLPIADYVLRTKKDSSEDALNAEYVVILDENGELKRKENGELELENIRSKLWICPYAPLEDKTFIQKHPDAKRVQPKVTVA